MTTTWMPEYGCLNKVHVPMCTNTAQANFSIKEVR